MLNTVNFLDQIRNRNPNINEETGERLQIPAGQHILTLTGFNWGPAKPSNNSDSKYFEFVFTHPDYPRNPYAERTYYQNKQGELIRTKETGDLFWLDNLTSTLVKLSVKLADIKSGKFKMPAVGTQGSISSLIRRGVQILALFEEVVEVNKETGKQHQKIKVVKFTKLPNAKGELVTGENNNVNSAPVIPAEFKALPSINDEDDHYGDSEMSESDSGTSSVVSTTSTNSTRPAGLEKQGSNKRQKNSSSKSTPIVIDTTSKSFAEKEVAALKEVQDKIAAKRKEAEEKERAKIEKEAKRVAEKEEKERAKAEEKKQKDAERNKEAEEKKKIKEAEDLKRKQDKIAKENEKKAAKELKDRVAAEAKRLKEEDRLIKQKIKDQMAKTGGVSVNFPSQPQREPNSVSMVSSQASEASSDEDSSDDSDSEDFDEGGAMDLSTM